MGNVPPITGRHGQAGKLARRCPRKRDMFAAYRLADDADRPEDDEKVRAGISDGEVLVAHFGDLDT